VTEDWLDPFNESEEDREREARRLEREARRRARLGKKVEKEARSAPPEPEPEPEPAQAQAAPAVEAAPAAAETAPPLETLPPDETAAASAWSARRPPSTPTRPPRGGYRARRIALGLVLAALVGIGVFAFLLFQPFHGEGSGRVEVTIPKGASASDIADLLDKKGVVSNSTFFHLRLSMSGKSSEIQAGKFALRHDMSYGDAIDVLATKPKPIKPKTITVTIPEGYDRTQTADLLKQDGVKGDYMKETESYRGFKPEKYGAKNPSNLEGFLFPATYKLKPGEDAHDLVGQQLTAYEQNIGSVNLKYAKSKNLTPYDVTIIGSLIEREAGKDVDRPKVAAVIYNRLHKNMPLQIDATIRFAENNYTKALTSTDLALDSPYNSYTHPGLPPGPIANPGLASLEAAAKPAKAGYLYYLTKPGACGKLEFATTLAQHQRQQAAYENARNAAGGKSPTTC
jgi:uncharacterized YceG family protein